MDRFLYLSMSGAKEIVRAQGVNANNLANVSTYGFRADLETAKNVQVYGDGYASRVYSQAEGTGVDLKSGHMVKTGRALDIALSDKGYIAVQSRDGKEAYTRSGNLKITANGQLLTGSGHPVMGNSGPISIPPSSKIEIGADGTITIQPNGQDVSALSVVDRIKLVKPDEKQLNKNEEGLLVLPEGASAPNADNTVKVSTGMLETSNVNAVSAMVRMIELARQFEINVKLMKTAEQNEAAASQLLSMN
jgi:flagellar basal-body rod protein FlgF